MRDRRPDAVTLWPAAMNAFLNHQFLGQDNVAGLLVWPLPWTTTVKCLNDFTWSDISWVREQAVNIILTYHLRCWTCSFGVVVLLVQLHQFHFMMSPLLILLTKLWLEQWVYRSFPLKAAACCCWEQAWLELWNGTKTVKPKLWALRGTAKLDHNSLLIMSHYFYYTVHPMLV